MTQPVFTFPSDEQTALVTLGLVQLSHTRVTSAQLLAAHSTPVQVVAEPDAGQIRVVFNWVAVYTAGKTPYGQDSQVELHYTNASGPQVDTQMVHFSDSDSFAVQGQGYLSVDGAQNAQAKPLVIRLGTQLTTGDGVLDVYVWWVLVS